jgi:hypothetical protein
MYSNVTAKTPQAEIAVVDVSEFTVRQVDGTKLPAQYVWQTSKLLLSKGYHTILVAVDRGSFCYTHEVNYDFEGGRVYKITHGAREVPCVAELSANK